MFTKDDLKTGMFIKLRKGLLGVIIYDDILLENGNYMPLNSYDSTLKCCDSGGNNMEYDIIEVRSVGKESTTHHFQFSTFDYMYLEYQRPQFELSDIQNGDIIIINLDGMGVKSFYKVDNLLLPTNPTVGAYNLEEFDNDLRLKLNSNIKITKVIRPSNVVEYADSQKDVAKVVYKRED